MEKIIKDFKGLSYFIGAMGIIKLGTSVGDVKKLMNLDVATMNTMTNMDYVSMGVSAETMLSIVKIASLIPMVLFTLALFFLAYKGIKEANDPSNAKFHLVLAVICAVFFALSCINSVVTACSPNADVMTHVLDATVSGCDSFLLIYYFLLGKKIRTAE